MAISKEKKQQVVTELKDMLTRSRLVIISDYRGLTAEQMVQVRNRLRPLNSRFIVAKNTLVLKSLAEAALPQPEALLQGPTALSFCFEDMSQPVKAIQELAAETEILSIKGGLLGDRVLNAQDVKILGQLPKVEVLRAEALAGVQSPVAGFVGLLDSALRGLLYTLNARAEEMGKAAA
ncbi:MAG: 50S ribosomal protein L10 [Chloroflexi bacterium]|nr:50S ribosomal protein L10 [Chloroflexota bacterium]